MEFLFFSCVVVWFPRLLKTRNVLNQLNFHIDLPVAPVKMQLCPCIYLRITEPSDHMNTSHFLLKPLVKMS